jgi:hypothetical protein
MAVIVSIYRWLRTRFWGRPEPLQLARLAPPRPVPVVLTATAPALAVAPDPEPPARDPEPPLRRQFVHDTGPLQVHWHFKTAILDRLDEYFVCLQRLRRHDRDSYALFSQVGLAIPADCYLNWENPNKAAWALSSPERPGHGGILLGGVDSDRAFMYPSLIYFRKIRYPVGVERAHGDVYELTALYDNRQAAYRWTADFAAPLRCHFVVERDHTVRLLREHCCVERVIERHSGRQRERFTLTAHRWQVPEWTQWMAEDHGGRDVPRMLFIMALGTYQEAIQRIVVRVRRGEMVAAFGIDLPRAKYFFADRALDVARDGRRKRIFHAVVEHDRQVRTKTTRVRAHYRGSRHFEWQGSHIDITYPGRERLMRLPFASRDLATVPEEARFRFDDSARAGAKISAALSK